MIYDVVVIGGGPAGLSAALSASKNGCKVLIIERAEKLGGILKQCIHDGFGLLKFKEKLTGPEYAQRYINEIIASKIEVQISSYVIQIEKVKNHFLINFVNKKGINSIVTQNIIFATGCRERTRNQIQLPGDRPVGIYTAGTVQYLINILGISPCKKAVILGSGDIGLIMARRMHLEGVSVEGVYEIKSNPSGLQRNIHQCLFDYKIPLHLSHTITNILGKNRLEAVEICQVDENMQPIKSTKRLVSCDGLILAVGLIPENEVCEKLDIKIDPKTKGPYVDQNMMTTMDGVFSIGNSLHVHDLVDYVSEGGEVAGSKIKKEVVSRSLIDIKINDQFLYLVPQYLNLNENLETLIYFRTKKILNNVKLTLSINGILVFEKRYQELNPPEMERLKIDFSKYSINVNSEIFFAIEVIE